MVDATIGVYDEERNKKQKILIDLEIEVDATVASRTDSINDSADYAKISEMLVDHIEQTDFFLIETLAQEVADLIVNEFRVPWVRVVLRKPDALEVADEVGVEIERVRSN